MPPSQCKAGKEQGQEKEDNQAFMGGDGEAGSYMRDEFFKVWMMLGAFFVIKLGIH